MTVNCSEVFSTMCCSARSKARSWRNSRGTIHLLRSSSVVISILVSRCSLRWLFRRLCLVVEKTEECMSLMFLVFQAKKTRKSSTETFILGSVVSLLGFLILK
jgi:hypothetical protein